MFTVSFYKNGVYQTRLVDSKDKKIAEKYFRSIEPNAEFLGISVDQCHLERRGCPVEKVPENFR